MFSWIYSRLTVLDEDKIGFDYIGEYRVPLKSIQIDEINEYEIELEEVKEVCVEDILLFNYFIYKKSILT